MEQKIEKKKFTILGIDLWEILAYFIIYSIAGFFFFFLFALATVVIAIFHAQNPNRWIWMNLFILQKP